MIENVKRPLLKVREIWEYYDLLKYGHLLRVENNEMKIEKLRALGLDFNKVKEICKSYNIQDQQHGFIMGIVHLFFNGYNSAKSFESNYKANSLKIKNQMKQILHLDLDQISEIVIKTKFESIKLDSGITTFEIIETLREMKENLFPEQIKLYGNKSYYKTYINTHLRPFYKFLVDQSFFETYKETRNFIVDLCECFNICWESFTKSDPLDYLKDRFKEVV